MGTWNSISGLFQSGNVLREGVKKPCFLQLLSEKPIRDFNLSLFREIEPDQVKVCLQFVERKSVVELGFDPVSQGL